MVSSQKLQRFTPAWPMTEEDGDWLPALVDPPIQVVGHTGRVPVPVFRTQSECEPL
jgi:hypothetical protein